MLRCRFESLSVTEKLGSDTCLSRVVCKPGLSDARPPPLVPRQMHSECAICVCVQRKRSHIGL